VKTVLFPMGRLMANCAVVLDEKGTAAVIDPGGDPAPVLEYIADSGAGCCAILLTHGHGDHTEGVEKLRSETGAPVYIGEGDAGMLTGPADVLLTGGEVLEFGGLSFEVIAAPGHTPGGVCYLSEGILFAGDTLFRGSVGRTDLPGGDSRRLMDTLAALTARFSGSDVVVVPGHGELTDFKYETEHNPFL